MAIFFEFYETPNPTGEEKLKYHARTVNLQTVDTNAIANEIQQMSSLTQADIKAVLVALSHRVAYHLGNSERVHLEGLGYFESTLKYVREIDPDKTRAQSVWFKSVAYRPDQELKSQLVNAPTMRSEIKRHSQKFTDQMIDEKVDDYLEENPFITRRLLEGLCSLRPTNAGRHIKRMIEEGKIKNINTVRQPVYVKA